MRKLMDQIALLMFPPTRANVLMTLPIIPIIMTQFERIDKGRCAGKRLSSRKRVRVSAKTYSPGFGKSCLGFIEW